MSQASGLVADSAVDVEPEIDAAVLSALDPAVCSAIDPALGRFAPIALDELVSEAELLTRVDRKYLVPVAEAVAILHELDPHCRVLDIDGRRAFGYDSVYFDTADHLAFRLTAQRRRRRFKLRTRSYLDTGGTFLELKTKSGRGRTVKERVPCAASDRGRIAPAAAAYVAERLQQRGIDADLVPELHPTLVSRYRRATLLLPGGSRATFDDRLRWRDARSGRSLHLPHYVIIESKSAGTATALDRELWRRGHRPGGLSKFGTGTAALHPELPSNRWSRVLRGPFADAERALETEPTSYAEPTAHAGPVFHTEPTVAAEQTFDPDQRKKSR